MKIVRDFPPIYDEITAAFPAVAGRRGIIFAWGETIFNPTGVDIPPELIVHEEVHGGRQKGDVEGWWRRYIDDPEFRLHEEILAHCREYGFLLKGNRHERRRALVSVSKRLASPLYGRMVTLGQARKVLREVAEAA